MHAPQGQMPVVTRHRVAERQKRCYVINVYAFLTMNSLYTLGVRQTNSLQADLERLRNGDNSTSLLGPPCSINFIMHWLTCKGPTFHRLARADFCFIGSSKPNGGRL